jgi:hypothetical protein
VGILVFSKLSCCLGEVAIDGKSLWRYPHVSAIFAEVNATVKSDGCPARTKNETFSGSPPMNLASISCSGFCNKVPFSII